MYNIIQGVVSAEYAETLSHNTAEPIRCHIKIDTGMGRIGLKYDTPQECADEIMRIMEIEKICVEGIYTHFAAADSDSPDNIAYTDKQEKFILDVRDILIS
jgi:alanine racemase